MWIQILEWFIQVKIANPMLSWGARLLKAIGMMFLIWLIKATMSIAKVHQNAGIEKTVKNVRMEQIRVIIFQLFSLQW
jgi:hypothetical protein